MKILRIINSNEESESYLESFLDVLLCGLGASLALMIVYSVLPKGGLASQSTQEESNVAELPSNTGLTNNNINNLAPVVVIDAHVDTKSAGLPTANIAGFQLVKPLGQQLATLQAYRNAERIGVQFGYESLYRFPQTSGDDVVLEVHRSLLNDLHNTVKVTIFMNGAVETLALEVTASGLGSGRTFEVTADKVLKHTRSFHSSPDYVPLFWLTSNGELIGLRMN